MHFVGAITYLWFSFDNWNKRAIWPIWVFCKFFKKFDNFDCGSKFYNI